MELGPPTTAAHYYQSDILRCSAHIAFIPLRVTALAHAATYKNPRYFKVKTRSMLNGDQVSHDAV